MAVSNTLHAASIPNIRQMAATRPQLQQCSMHLRRRAITPLTATFWYYSRDAMSKRGICCRRCLSANGWPHCVGPVCP